MLRDTDSVAELVDGFGRKVNYLRLSVTDRCDFRCVYCMAEEMTFLPRNQILSLEELALVAKAFTELGVKKIRLTGGEPLVRADIEKLVKEVSDLPGLDEVVLTSNGSQLSRLAQPLFDAGLARINISLDSLKAHRFKSMTRVGDLRNVLAGIESAKQAGFNEIKLNAVILKGRNDDEILNLLEFACENSLDLTFIEEMPLGLIGDHDREVSYISSAEIRQVVATEYELTAVDDTTGGPARYFSINGASTRLGFISPISQNFCDSCNRVRVTVEGRLLLCLGNEHSLDLRKIIRENPGELEVLKRAIVEAMSLKPAQHEFDLQNAPKIVRFMNATGG